MSWAIGWDSNWNRWIGYGVPAWCDHPKCRERIDRGLAYVCGGEPYGGENGCGLFFCPAHMNGLTRCPRCARYKAPYKHPKPEHPEWVMHVATDPSWAEWRTENPGKLAALRGGAPTGETRPE